MSKDKPKFEDVLKYVDKQIDIQISKIASSIPDEQKDEIRQDARIRAWKAYERIEADKGWKSFIQFHCKGSVLDYLRWGKGFAESTLAEKNFDAENEDPKPWRLRQRLNFKVEDGETSSLEEMLSFFGKHIESPDPLEEKPNWDLIARMASQDQDIHMVAKLMIGFTHEQVAEIWKVSRERITQKLAEFCERLNAPEHMGSRWTAQTIYAFGLCAKFHQPVLDLGFGWEYDKIDLFATNLDYLDSINPQLTFEFVFN